jgi:ectoine hydroxylase-related dioxygenase (phytanoyl-CoA dioxygenase family)
VKLTAEQIYNYQNDGVILIKNAFVPWIEKLKIGFDKVLKNPGIHARENVENQNNGRFFEDYCNWERIDEFKDFILNSPAAEIASQSTGSKNIQIFHEHIFLKDPNTIKETPWHQDLPYYCIDGNDTVSFWIPLDNVSKENSLRVLKGSHKLPKLVKPTKWSNNKSWYEHNELFMDMPSIEENDIFCTEMKIGDAIMFNFKVLHSTLGNTEDKTRKAFSARFIGDDVRYIDRKGETSPPFKGINLKNGDKMREDWFPKVWGN